MISISSFQTISPRKSPQHRINYVKTNMLADSISFKGIEQTSSSTSDFFLRLKVKNEARKILKSATKISSEAINEYQNAQKCCNISSLDSFEQSTWYIQEEIQSIESSEKSNMTFVTYNNGDKDIIIQDSNNTISCIIKRPSIGKNKVFLYSDGELRESFKTRDYNFNSDFRSGTEEQYQFTDGELTSYTPKKNAYGVYPIMHQLYCFKNGSISSYMENVHMLDKTYNFSKLLTFKN